MRGAVSFMLNMSNRVKNVFLWNMSLRADWNKRSSCSCLWVTHPGRSRLSAAVVGDVLPASSSFCVFEVGFSHINNPCGQSQGSAG